MAIKLYVKQVFEKISFNRMLKFAFCRDKTFTCRRPTATRNTAVQAILGSIESAQNSSLVINSQKNPRNSFYRSTNIRNTTTPTH